MNAVRADIAVDGVPVTEGDAEDMTERGWKILGGDPRREKPKEEEEESALVGPMLVIRSRSPDVIYSAFNASVQP